MAEERFGTDALIDRVQAFAKANGINSFVFMADDPDSDVYFMTRKGSRLWAIGALREYEYTLKNDKPETQIDEDDLPRH